MFGWMNGARLPVMVWIDFNSGPWTSRSASHASWLAFDPHAQFHDEIDLSAIFEENALRPRL
jgi:hypothetical protein